MARASYAHGYEIIHPGMEIRGGWKNAPEQKNKGGMENPARLNPNKRGLGKSLRTKNKRGMGNLARLNPNKSGLGKSLRTKNKMGVENPAHLSPHKGGVGHILRTRK